MKHHRRASDHLSHHRIVLIQMGSRLGGNKKLTPHRTGVFRNFSHGDQKGSVEFQVVFLLFQGVTGPTSAIAPRASGLNSQLGVNFVKNHSFDKRESLSPSDLCSHLGNFDCHRRDPQNSPPSEEPFFCRV